MTRTSLTRYVAALAAAAIVVVACGGAGPTTAPTAGPETAAPMSQGPTVVPATQAPASLFPGFSMPSVDKELEGLLPDEIAGETVTKASVGGEQMVAGPGGAELLPVLTALGKTPADLTAGVGSTSKAFFLAFRIKGVDASAFFDAFIDAATDEPASQITNVTIAGKQARKVVDTAGTTTYLYFTGDAIITVSPIVASDAIITEIFQKLP